MQVTLMFLFVGFEYKENMFFVPDVFMSMLLR